MKKNIKKRSTGGAVKIFILTLFLREPKKIFSAGDIFQEVKKRWGFENRRGVNRHLSDLFSQGFLVFNYKNGYSLPENWIGLKHARKMFEYFKKVRIANPKPFKGMIPTKPGAYFDWDKLPSGGTYADERGLPMDLFWFNLPKTLSRDLQKQLLDEAMQWAREYDKKMEIPRVIRIIEEKTFRSRSKVYPIKLDKKQLRSDMELLQSLLENKEIPRKLVPLVKHLILDLKFMITEVYVP